MTNAPANRDSQSKRSKAKVAEFTRSSALASPEARQPSASAPPGESEEIVKLKTALLSARDHQVRHSRSHVAELASLQNALSRAEQANQTLEQQHARLQARELAIRNELTREVALVRAKFQKADRIIRIMDQLDEIARRTLPISRSGKGLSPLSRAAVAINRARRGKRTGASFVASELLRHELRKSPLFNVSWYRSQRSDLRTTTFDLVDHFVLYGIEEGTSPHPLIDVDWIARSAGLARRSALQHYLLRGRRAVVRPTALFDVLQYRKIARLNASADALTHYLWRGRALGLSPHPLFDPVFYSRQLPNIALWNIDPFVHYVLFPFELDPHPFFSTGYYLSQHPELRARNISPLQHYLEYGTVEKTSPHPNFSGPAYLDSYPDVAAAVVNPLLHYIVFGRAEGRRTYAV